MLETLLFLALGIIKTLGLIISHGTSSKFADVRPHLRKVSKVTLSSILKEAGTKVLASQLFLDCRARRNG